MKTLTDFRKTVETGVDPRLLTDLKPLFIPLAALALKCYECSEDPGSVGKCGGANIGQIGNKTCVPLLNRCSTVRYTLKGTSLTALSCANSMGCDPLSQYSCKLKYQLFYRWGILHGRAGIRNFSSSVEKFGHFVLRTFLLIQSGINS